MRMWYGILRALRATVCVTCEPDSGTSSKVQACSVAEVLSNVDPSAVLVPRFSDAIVDVDGKVDMEGAVAKSPTMLGEDCR